MRSQDMRAGIHRLASIVVTSLTATLQACIFVSKDTKMHTFKPWREIHLDKAIPKMALHNAFAYTLKPWPCVENVLRDGRLELSNNLAERSIKPFDIGRKNYFFSDTPQGTHASAAMCSVLISAKLNGIKPRDYTEWLLEQMPNTENIGDASVLEDFMP